MLLDCRPLRDPPDAAFSPESCFGSYACPGHPHSGYECSNESMKLPLYFYGLFSNVIERNKSRQRLSTTVSGLKVI